MGNRFSELAFLILAIFFIFGLFCLKYLKGSCEKKPPCRIWTDLVGCRTGILREDLVGWLVYLNRSNDTSQQSKQCEGNAVRNQRLMLVLAF